jgi:hypothetical protein
MRTYGTYSRAYERWAHAPILAVDRDVIMVTRP